MGIGAGLGLSKSVWSITFKTLARYPRLLFPFLIKAIFEGLILTVLFYFPRPPFSAIFAPPVKAFYDSRFLHYPDNFIVLPQLFYYGQIIAVITVGVVMYGMAIGMVNQAHAPNEEVKIFGNMNRSLRRYLSLLGVWTFMFILSLILIQGPVFLITKFLQPTAFLKTFIKIFSYIGILLAVLIETLFIYAYAAVIIERKGVIGAIRRSLGIVKAVFLTTFVLIATPRILDIFVILARQKLKGLMNLTFPEITLVFLAGAIIVTFVTDSLVFLSTTSLFILKKETEKEP